MRRWRAEDFWFELSTGPDPTSGRPIRYYLVRCRGCSQTSSIHAHGMAETKLRKYFSRHGWQIGKTRNAHLCPDCVKRATPQEPEPITAPITPASHEPIQDLLYHSFLLAEPYQRREFLLKLMNKPDELEIFTTLLREVGLLQPTDTIPLHDMSWLNGAMSDDEIAVAVIEQFGEQMAAMIGECILRFIEPSKQWHAPQAAAKPEPIAAPQSEPEPEPEPEPEDQDDTPADWWLELQKAAPRRRKALAE